MNPVSEAIFTFKSFCQFKGQDMDAMQKAMQYIFPKMTKLFFLIKKKNFLFLRKANLKWSLCKAVTQTDPITMQINNTTKYH